MLLVINLPPSNLLLFFFNDTATTEIYTLSLHDALPILRTRPSTHQATPSPLASRRCGIRPLPPHRVRTDRPVETGGEYQLAGPTRTIEWCRVQSPIHLQVKERRCR